MRYFSRYGEWEIRVNEKQYSPKLGQIPPSVSTESRMLLIWNLEQWLTDRNSYADAEKSRQ